MSIKRRYLKDGCTCKVTFTFPKDGAESARTVHLVGEFNDWKYDATPMKKLKSGAFSVALDLDCGRAYQFRYLIDGASWENDSKADKYVPSPYPDSENSVVEV